MGGGGWGTAPCGVLGCLGLCCVSVKRPALGSRPSRLATEGDNQLLPMWPSSQLPWRARLAKLRPQSQNVRADTVTRLQPERLA